MFENKLYPSEVIKLTAIALSCHDKNQDLIIDKTLAKWVANLDERQYIKDICTAVKKLNCLDIVLARLNFEALLDQSEDKITISRFRKQKLFGEDNNFNENYMRDDDFYSETITLKNAQIRPTFSLETKVSVLEFLEHIGYCLTHDKNKAFLRLQSIVKSRTLEDQIISRICYLIMFDFLLKNKSSLLNSQLLLTYG